MQFNDLDLKHILRTSTIIQTLLILIAANHFLDLGHGLPMLIVMSIGVEIGISFIRNWVRKRFGRGGK